MSKQPIKRKAGQTAEEMALQLQTQEGNRLFPSKANYKEISEQYKQEALSSSIALQAELLTRARERGRVNLERIEEIEAVVQEYMKACQQAGAYPTFEGLCAAMGCSRQNVYKWIARHNTSESAQYLDTIRTSWISILQQMTLSRHASEAVAIFLMNNAGLGFMNQQQIDITTAGAQNDSPLEPITEERQRELEERYALLFDSDPTDT